MNIFKFLTLMIAGKFVLEQQIKANELLISQQESVLTETVDDVSEEELILEIEDEVDKYDRMSPEEIDLRNKEIDLAAKITSEFMETSTGNTSYYKKLVERYKQKLNS